MLDLITLISAAGLQKVGKQGLERWHGQELEKAKGQTGEVIKEEWADNGSGWHPLSPTPPVAALVRTFIPFIK